MFKIKHETYNDGVLFFGEIKAIENEFHKKVGEELTVKGKLFFAKKSIREEDSSLADEMGKRLDLKVKTPYLKDVTSKMKCRIEGQQYDIIRIDRDKPAMYLYLQEVGV